MLHKDDHNQVLMVTSEQGRVYNLGGMTAIFKADENETAGNYSISEWWLDPLTEGPGVHQHEDKDQVFYILEGTFAVFIIDKWIDADKGTLIRIPKNTLHTFSNRTGSKAGMLNLDIPGGFEKNLPGMVKWFEENE